MASAKRTNAIVASLFPSNVRDRLLDAAADDEEGKQKKTDWNTKAFKTKEFNSGDLKGSEAIFGSKPIADLFPETTILFMDMVRLRKRWMH